MIASVLTTSQSFVIIPGQETMHRTLLAFASAFFLLLGMFASPVRADDTETLQEVVR